MAPAAPLRPVAFWAVLALLVIGSVFLIEFSRKSPSGTSAPIAPANGFPRSLRDSSGTDITIPAKPVRIVSQTLGTDEILLAICPQERIVGLSSLSADPKYSNVIAAARMIPGRTVTGAEEILQKKPDLIFVASYSRAEVVDLLKAAKAPVFRFGDFNSIDDIKNNIRTLGRAVGEEAATEALVAQMERDLTDIAARIDRSRPAPRVMSYGTSGFTAGGGTIFDDMVRAAGGVNVSTENGVRGFAKVSAEKVLDWQPDVIVVIAEDEKKEAVRKQLLDNPAVAASRAGKSGRVFVLSGREMLTVSHNVVSGVRALAQAIQAAGETK